MCLPLVGLVRAVHADQAEVELLGDGRVVSAGLGLYPETEPGRHVLIDRGLVIELIDAEQAEALLALYAEMAEFMEGESSEQRATSNEADDFSEMAEFARGVRHE